jgi:6-methylsalicylate decarboxylase
MNTNPKRVDVHHHVLPPAFVSALNSLNIKWTGGPEVPTWSLSQARDTMGQMGIDAAVASVSPGVYWGGDTGFAVSLARSSNEFLADVVRHDPEHFGGFATMPLPDVDSSLGELEYAYDTLGLDGVVLFTSQGDRYLGDPSYDPFFEELERRKAIVFIHPTTIPPGADATGLTIPYGVAEFVFDTTRCITNMLYRGTLERYPSIRYIVSTPAGRCPTSPGALPARHTCRNCATAHPRPTVWPCCRSCTTTPRCRPRSSSSPPCGSSFRRRRCCSAATTPT